MGLTGGQKEGLLALARKSLEAHLSGRKRLKKHEDYEPVCEEDLGAFVTLKTGDGVLRGCIGYIFGTGPLDETVADLAVCAASQDPRFPPVNRFELKSIRIEISVLTRPEKLDDPEGIVIGRDGLIVTRGRDKGLLLPQVATEWGFDKASFLEETCRKAGLESDAWTDPATVVERFGAEVFGEER